MLSTNASNATDLEILPMIFFKATLSFKRVLIVTDTSPHSYQKKTRIVRSGVEIGIGNLDTAAYLHEVY